MVGRKSDSASKTQAIAASLAVFTFEKSRDPASADRLLAMASQLLAAKEARALIEDLVPCRVDVTQWLHWLEGGSAPSTEFELRKPEEVDKKSASGRYQAALAKRDAARRDVERREAELASAKVVLTEAEDALDQVGGELRASVAFSLLKQVNRYASGAFAMGPAWSLMRIASGHLQHDPAFENTLSAEDRAFVARDRSGRFELSIELLDLLDRYSGDGELEFRLFRALLRAAREHEGRMNTLRANSAGPIPARAKRLRRKTEEQKACIHPDAPTIDRTEVLNNILTTEFEEPAELVNTGDAAGEDQEEPFF